MIKIIAKKIVRSVLSTLQNLMNESIENKKKLREELEAETDEEKQKELRTKISEKSTFEKFYQNFKGSLKVACYDDAANRKKISKLLMYQTSKHRDTEITLDQYIEEMPETQKTIYYASGESYDAIHNSPHLQGFRKRNIDVIYLTDTMDESCISQMYEYEGKKLQIRAKGDVDFERTPEEIEKDKLTKKKYAPLIKAFKEHINEIYDVKLSQRLTNDPCTVVVSDWGMSAHMEKIVKSYIVNKQESELNTFGAGMRSRILEINGEHPIMLEMLKRSINESNDSNFIDSLKLLYNAAKLAGGFTIENPTVLSHTAYAYLSDQLKVDSSITLDDIPYTPEPEKEDAPKVPEDMEMEEIDLDKDGNPVNDEL